MTFKLIIAVLISLFLLFSRDGLGQQNRTQYLQHDVAQTSFLNPAVPLSCGWTFSLPVIGSVHSNFGNNVASFNQLFNSTGNGNYTSDIAGAEKLLHGNNFILSEAQIQWLGLGYKKDKWSLMGTIIEKTYAFGNVPEDVFLLALHGNSQFAGQRVSLNRTSGYGGWYTEIGFSAAKEVDEFLSWGIRGKLLFGKMNLSTTKMKVGLATDLTTYNLTLDGNMDVRTSMPVWMEVENNNPTEVVSDESATPLSLFTEFGNPGIGFDFGVIKKVNDQVQVSASIVDLGIIMWSQNVHNYTTDGDFLYTGPLNDTIDTEDLGDALFDSLNLNTNQKGYITALPTKMMAGVKYTILPKLDLGAVADLQFYRSKFISGVQVQAAYQPLNNLKGVLSWGYQYNTLRNVGAGIIIGKNPIQFYAFTDNILGFTQALDARNYNIRIGINIVPGCIEKDTPYRVGSGVRKSALPGHCPDFNYKTTKRKKR